jgi:hypothetical protein
MVAVAGNEAVEIIFTGRAIEPAMSRARSTIVLCFTTRFEILAGS